ncbi:MAG: ftsA [Gammaproteobacteria bacterium]|jgi:cell division protein FtsA|nr:ftsA [Gammaproteobacteria bacterium]
MAKKKQDKQLIVSLDIGTSKVAALVGEIDDQHAIRIVGIGTAPSRGLKRGVVVDIESTVKSIQQAVEEAELMAGCQVHSAITGIAGSHVRSLNSHGIVAIRDKEVVQSDVDRVIDAARAVAIPADQKVLHVLPQEYIIDNQGGIREPIGMSGVRLEAKVHLVTGAVSAAQNIVKCMGRCNLAVGEMVLEQLASSEALLSDDEKELGVCLVDIGAGTTDIAVFTQGSIQHTAVIPIAGDQVTNDIAIALRTPTQSAEKIKLEYACAMPEMADPKQSIEVPSVANRPGRRVSHKTLAEIIGPRYQELFTLIWSELRRSGFHELIPAGIVLTGGASRVQGLVDLAEIAFQMPVRVAAPEGIEGLDEVLNDPAYSTSIGLLLMGQKQLYNAPTSRVLSSANGVFTKMRDWFSGNF